MMLELIKWGVVKFGEERLNGLGVNFDKRSIIENKVGGLADK